MQRGSRVAGAWRRGRGAPRASRRRRVPLESERATRISIEQERRARAKRTSGNDRSGPIRCSDVTLSALSQQLRDARAIATLDRGIETSGECRLLSFDRHSRRARRCGRR